MEALLLIWFSHHDAFQLRSLEGKFIIFAGPWLVDIFGRTRLAWACLGLEAHRLDTRAHTPDDDDMPLEA
jgi:hypothetical protein